MNKAFVKEADEEELLPSPEMPTGVHNYITPSGFARLQEELRTLHTQRSPSDDQQAHAVREREQRMHYLQTRIDTAEVVDASQHEDGGQVFFGASVRYTSLEDDSQHDVLIVGLDETDPAQGSISWLSPIAQALLGADEGDVVVLERPDGDEELLINTVRYPSGKG